MDNPLGKLVLTDEETLTEVVNCLAKHIPINSTGAVDPQNLFKVLVRAASKQNTIENTSKELKKATSGNNKGRKSYKTNYTMSRTKEYFVT